MADGRQIIATGETPTAAKLNKIAWRVIIDCTAGTHPSSPAAQTHIFETDTGLLRVWNGSAYETYGKGALGVNTVSGQSLTTALATVAGGSIAFDSVTDQVYEYRIDLRVQNGSTADDAVNVQLQLDDGGGYADWESVRTIPTHNTSFAYSASISTIWTATATDSCAFRARAAVVTGTGTIHGGAVGAGTTSRVSHLGVWL